MATTTAAAKDGKALTKTQMYAKVAESTGLTRKQVSDVVDSLTEVIRGELGKKGPGKATIPGLVKITKVTKPAQKAGQRPNPFKKGEMMEVAAKPARNVVKVRALKGLKDMA